MLGGSLISLPSPLASLSTVGEPILLGSREFHTQIEDGALTLTGLQIETTREKCRHATLASLVTELRCRKADLRAIKLQLEEALQRCEVDESEDTNELGIEITRLCAIKGQHQRRIAQLEDRLVSRVQYQETRITEKLTLRPGVPLRVSWMEAPLVWCPDGPQGNAVIEKETAEVQEDMPLMLQKSSTELYSFGGLGTGHRCEASMDTYDPVTKRWSDFSPLPRPRSNHAAAVVEGMVYLVGGSAGDEPVSTVDRFDPILNEWTALPPMLMEREHPAAAELDGFLYVAGGSTTARGSVSMERFDPNTKTWTFMHPMHLPRRLHTLTNVCGKLYVVGGEDHLSMVERFDPETNTWCGGSDPNTEATSRGGSRRWRSLCLGGKLSVRDEISNSVECFDPRSQLWSRLPPMLIPRAHHSVVALGGLLYVTGGNDSFDREAAAECFDPKTARWRRIETPLSVRRSCHASVAC